MFSETKVFWDMYILKGLKGITYHTTSISAQALANEFFDEKNPLILSNFLRFLAFLSRETLIWKNYNTDKLSLLT